jgi:hypothetical protein
MQLAVFFAKVVDISSYERYVKHCSETTVYLEYV